MALCASYVKRGFGRDVAVEVFKDPRDFVERCRDQPPHLAGFANYVWNSNLSLRLSRFVKGLGGDIPVVWGGPNYPKRDQAAFLAARPALDLHIDGEGEMVLAELVGLLLSDGAAALKAEPRAGCDFLDPAGRLVAGGAAPRLARLDDVPSPWLDGMLDRFFPLRFTPLLEFSRGCPYSCNYCNTGDSYFDKVRLLSDERALADLDHIARQAERHGIAQLILCDSNFGLLPRDVELARRMAELGARHGWPVNVLATSAKNAKKRVIEIADVLGRSMVSFMSVQSMDDGVLANIRRANISLADFEAVARQMARARHPQTCEFIAPLPGETFGGFVAGLRKILDSEVDSVVCHTLQANYGTAYRDDPAFRERNGFVVKHRLVPLDFSRLDGEAVFDVEQVVVATRDLAFEDYIRLRTLVFVVDQAFNMPYVRPLRRLIAERGAKVSDLVLLVFETLDEVPPAVRAVLESFVAETRSELWDDEAALILDLTRDYDAVVAGERGGNVLFRHRVLMLAGPLAEWLDHVFGCAARVLGERAAPGQLDDVRAYCLGLGGGLLDAARPDHVTRLGHDVVAWMDAPDAILDDHRRQDGVAVEFFLPPSERQALLDGLDRYGGDVNGLVKLMQRLSRIIVRAARHA